MTLSPEAAIERIGQGGLIGFPTETAWGLGADAGSEAAMAALRAFKGRAGHQPVSVLVSGADALGPAGATLGPAARALVAAFWPGPLTLVLPCDRGFAAGVADARGAVGFRCSSHPVAAVLASLAEDRGTGPITATSLNRSGAPECNDRVAARACAGRRAALVVGVDAGGAPPSTVVDLATPDPRILREGAVPRADVETILAREPVA